MSHRIFIRRREKEKQVDMIAKSIHSLWMSKVNQMKCIFSYDVHENEKKEKSSIGIQLGRAAGIIVFILKEATNPSQPENN